MGAVIADKTARVDVPIWGINWPVVRWVVTAVALVTGDISAGRYGKQHQNCADYGKTLYAAGKVWGHETSIINVASH
jgi:hypothetical protein